VPELCQKAISRRIERLGVLNHGIANEGLEAIFGDEIHLPAKQFGQIKHEAGMIQQPGFGLGKKFNQEVDVAVRPHCLRRG